MISGANMELYIQLLHQYAACPVHPVQAKTTGIPEEEERNSDKS